MKLYRTVDADMSVEDGKREVIARISSEQVDSYNSVVLADGIQKLNYNNLPVFYNHGYIEDIDKMPVGKCRWVKIQKPYSIAKFAIFDEGQYFDFILRRIQDGTFNSTSIGFDAIDWRRPEPEDIKNNPDWAAAEIIYTNIKLVEISVCWNPANSDAVIELVSKCKKDGLKQAHYRSIIPEELEKNVVDKRIDIKKNDIIIPVLSTKEVQLRFLNKLMQRLG